MLIKLKAKTQGSIYAELEINICVDSQNVCTYKYFKISVRGEVYIDTIEIGTFSKRITPFRASCHNLMIENGRHYNILLEDRRYVHVYCETEKDEFHFVIKCPIHVYTEIRHKFVDETFVVNISYIKTV